jgi:hypothetical protein
MVNCELMNGEPMIVVTEQEDTKHDPYAHPELREDRLEDPWERKDNGTVEKEVVARSF